MASVKQIIPLTALRGVAAWWVVAYHFRDQLAGAPLVVKAVLDRGYLAADVFFVLSGFVIGLNHAADFHRPSWRAIRAFLVARLARIYPLYMVMALAFLAVPPTRSASPVPAGVVDWATSLMMMQTWGFVRTLAGDPPAWAVSAEWFAYLCFPLLAFAAIRLLRGPNLPIAAAIVLCGAIAIIFRISGTASLGDEVARFGLIRCLLEFALGLAVCRAGMVSRPMGAVFGNVLAVAAAALIGAGLVGPWRDYDVVPAAIACLVLALTVRTAALPRLLTRPWAIYLGEISYSTYLAHFLVRDWISFLFVRPGGRDPLAFLFYLTVTMTASVLLYRFVEMPGRDLVRAVLAGRARGEAP